MYIRFHKGQFADAVVSTSVGIAPSPAPGDIVWSLPSDVNPSKTVQETRNVQATDPLTGALLFNEDGTPQWETTNALDASGKPIPILDSKGNPETDAKGNPIYQQVVVTEQIPVTYTLMQNPNIFTQADINAVLINPPTVVS